ncbi:MAG: DUF1926 domain-containing protein, partial [Chloroflexi bacterium]|nr:DUF1926 domain-containing protein [Chloroflexota bacterium]
EPAIRVAASSSLPADLDARPVETVSQWEGGFERIRQCLSCLFSWPIELDAGERFTVELALRVDGGGA